MDLLPMVKLPEASGIHKVRSLVLERKMHFLGVWLAACHLATYHQLPRFHVKAVICRPNLGALVVARGPQRLVRHPAELALGDVDKVRPHRQRILTKLKGGETG